MIVQLVCGAAQMFRSRLESLIPVFFSAPLREVKAWKLRGTSTRLRRPFSIVHLCSHRESRSYCRIGTRDAIFMRTDVCWAHSRSTRYPTPQSSTSASSPPAPCRVANLIAGYCLRRLGLLPLYSLLTLLLAQLLSNAAHLLALSRPHAWPADFTLLYLATSTRHGQPAIV